MVYFLKTSEAVQSLKKSKLFQILRDEIDPLFSGILTLARNGSIFIIFQARH